MALDMLLTRFLFTWADFDPAFLCCISCACVRARVSACALVMLTAQDIMHFGPYPTPVPIPSESRAGVSTPSWCWANYPQKRFAPLGMSATFLAAACNFYGITAEGNAGDTGGPPGPGF